MSRPSYELCSQTVTIYSRIKKGVQRRVLENSAYLAPERSWRLTAEGLQATAGFLLIVPAECGYRPAWELDELEGAAGCFTLRRGDKVMRGVGPVLTADEQWLELLPDAGRPVYVVGQIRECFDAKGALTHVDARE